MTHSVIRNVAAGYNAVDFFELRLKLYKFQNKIGL